jgi:hypothetical protein
MATTEYIRSLLPNYKVTNGINARAIRIACQHPEVTKET